jgi:dTDP-4-dehydrorhamnose 3,5-epimerase
LTEDCELIYLHSRPFTPEAEGALNVRDPTLAIAWPLDITELSERDAQHPMLQETNG